MREFLLDLTTALGQVCSTFLHVPSKTPYPYITIEPEQKLQGLPWGPSIILLRVRLWSRYEGLQEVLNLAKSVETLLHGYAPRSFDASLKILESALVLLNDGQTRVHTFRLKARFLREMK